MSEQEDRDALKEMGIDEAEIDAAIREQQAIKQPDAIPDIQPANLLIASLFFSVSRYWCRAGMEAQPMYLDPAAIQTRANHLTWYQGITSEEKERVWDGLEVMENACLQAWAEQKG